MSGLATRYKYVNMTYLLTQHIGNNSCDRAAQSNRLECTAERWPAKRISMKTRMRQLICEASTSVNDVINKYIQDTSGI